MIRIISITNAHEFDGIEITEKQFDDLCKLLSLSSFAHTVRYINDKGKELMAFIER